VLRGLDLGAAGRDVRDGVECVRAWLEELAGRPGDCLVGIYS
jgi:hypothetical protein